MATAVRWSWEENVALGPTESRVLDGSGAGPHKVTSYDVARRAGVSQSAVSRVFKPGSSVSEKMRNRVLAAAQELGYRPNAIARSLITRRSNMVGVIISNLTNLYYPEVLSELTHRFSGVGQRVLLFTLPQESDVDRMLQDVLGYQVDGIVSTARLSAEQVAECHGLGCPVVLYNRSFRDVPASSVCCDQVEAGRLIATKLVDAGHQQFGFVAGPTDSVVSQERTRGFLARLEELGLFDVPVVDGDYSYASGYGCLQELARRRPGLDAVVCANDVMALGVIDAARFALGRRVPEDISVAGFDGVDPARWASYDLTTVRQPVRRMTQATVETLLERVEDPAVRPTKRVLPGELIVGSTVRGLGIAAALIDLTTRPS